MRNAIMARSAAAIGPYSHGVISISGYAYLSGQTPLDPVTGRLVTGDVGAQTTQCLNNLESVLREAGLTFDDVVKCNVYLTDMADFEDMNSAYAQRFKQPFPARTTIGVAALPANASVEIEMIAQIPSAPR
ncbi:RidA family protein [Neorhizobium alkalisoli]|uniref:RidA family protein n=1 Tax=Neorhizobium alkalisoli TaxID=528178 RepID=UPI000CF86CE6|nr:Rid family detoxifying hydrolase [Neorhizobium alkalisoli]